jgi:OmcA/MtrC family decaheme c-type cytochrome
MKIGCLIVSVLGLFVLLDPGGLTGAQEQVLPRPGLNVHITNVTIPESRRPEVTVRITDERGTPLDRQGVLTEGVVTLRFIIARINPGDRQYTAYTVRRQTGAVLGTVEQASADTGGAFTEVGPGEYLYRFGTALPENYDRTVTHTVGVYADRNLRHVDGNDYVAAATFDFVPDGRAVTVVRDIVTDESCNRCHGQLTAHGVRRSVAVCVLCHTPQTPDPDTGNTTDFNVMIHKIHRGADLPSVQAGTPYQIIGFQQTVADYSTVRLPQDIRNCATCHTGSQATTYLTRLSRAACGSCHDNVNFATGQNHASIPQTNDNLCQACHQPTSDTEFDISVAGSHVIPTKSRQLPGVNYQIVRVENTNPGQNLSVIFNVKDAAGNIIQPGQMSTLNAVFGGPTRDYANWYSESARMAMPTADGNFSFTFARPIPPDATGTYTVGLEGRRNVNIQGPNRQMLTVQDAGPNATLSFAVTGQLVSRRAVVDVNKCNACHDTLRLHGNNRVDNTQYCALCHNPNQTDVARRPQDQLPAQTVDFKLMIHRIHSGEELQNEYTVYGFGNVAHNYNEVRYPTDTRNCTMCHTEGTQLIGSTAGRLPTVNPRSFVDPTPPVSAACIGCHDSIETLAHVAVNSSMRGESCSVCHGEGRDFAVSRVHFRRPDAANE